MSEDKKLSQRLTEILMELDEVQKHDLFAYIEAIEPVVGIHWPRDRMIESQQMTDEIKNFLIKYVSYLMRIGK